MIRARMRRGRALTLVLAAALAVFNAPIGFFCAAEARELKDLAPASGSVVASSPRFEVAADGRIRFSMAVTEPLDHEVFSLGPNGDRPDRLVVDLPQLEWSFGDRAALGARFGVRKLRHGLFRVGRSRLVLELDGAPEVLRSGSTRSKSGDGAIFMVEFKLDGAAQAARAGEAPLRLPAAARRASDGGDRGGLSEAVRAALGAGAAAASDPAPRFAPAPRVKPRAFVVALDPGHGGKDPGANYGDAIEKEIVLDFAKRLREKLARPGLLRVVLTRETDEFVELAERVARARAQRANLFVSLHADAIVGHPEISGASIYTLSATASDDLADQLARRENAADALAGVRMDRQGDDIREILVDLAKRRAMERSEQFAGVAIEALSRRVPVLESKPHRRAGFRVLKTFDTPAALVELGFLTNVRDRRRLMNPAWREEAAEALAEAIRLWRDETTRPAVATAAATGGRG